MTRLRWTARKDLRGLTLTESRGEALTHYYD